MHTFSAMFSFLSTSVVRLRSRIRHDSNKWLHVLSIPVTNLWSILYWKGKSEWTTLLARLLLFYDEYNNTTRGENASRHCSWVCLLSILSLTVCCPDLSMYIILRAKSEMLSLSQQLWFRLSCGQQSQVVVSIVIMGGHMITWPREIPQATICPIHIISRESHQI